MREVVIKITMPDNWVEDITKKYSTPIKFKQCKPYGESGGRGLIEIGDTCTVTDTIIEEIKQHPNVCTVNISQLKEGGVLGSVITNKCAACKALTGSDCFLISASSHTDGGVEWRLITGGDNSLSTLIKNLEKNGCKVELLNTKRLTKTNILTNRQEIIIQTAFEKGYYDYPKKITIKELAQLFGISSSTLDEILRRGEKNIISEHFHNKT